MGLECVGLKPALNNQPKRENTMNKSQVINAWSQGRYARTPNGSLTADSNGQLRSYNLVIGMRTATGLIVGDFTAIGKAFYSMTTSHHVSDAKHVARLVEPSELTAALNATL